MQDKLLFQLAVIADTHIRLPDSAEKGGYPSNRLSNDRAKYVVQCLNRIKPDFVIHLGDKPNASLPAPVVDEKIHQIFTKYWGPMY